MLVIEFFRALLICCRLKVSSLDDACAHAAADRQVGLGAVGKHQAQQQLEILVDLLEGQHFGVDRFAFGNQVFRRVQQGQDLRGGDAGAQQCRDGGCRRNAGDVACH